ncbi:hypothetical protein [Bordetella genomosp. 1]|nr:hypothetical protein [Bordetella genomosp. 1]
MISLRFGFILKNRAQPGRGGTALWAGLMALLLAACSPSYNWRELTVADGRVRAAFPAKVRSETRELPMPGHTLAFTLSSAQVGDGVFAIGHAVLPPDLSAQARRQLGEAAQRSLYARLGLAPPADLPAFGAVMHLRAPPGEPARWLHARVWVSDGLLVQAVAAGTVAGLPQAEAETFLKSVVLAPAP